MDEQKSVILGKSRPASARPRRITIPEKKNEQLQCVERNIPIKQQKQLQ
jgi:hypothetical protein